MLVSPGRGRTVGPAASPLPHPTVEAGMSMDFQFWFLFLLRRAALRQLRLTAPATVFLVITLRQRGRQTVQMLGCKSGSGRIKVGYQLLASLQMQSRLSCLQLSGCLSVSLHELSTWRMLSTSLPPPSTCIGTSSHLPAPFATPAAALQRPAAALEATAA
ncbi:hypothetical protein V8C44DRAFT_92596 [Trichoderma aethiopicum]